MGYQVRQLGLGGILDQAVKLTKDNFGMLLGIALVLLIPFAVIQGYVADSTTPQLPPQPTEEDVVAYQQAVVRTLAFCNSRGSCSRRRKPRAIRVNE